jgi:hypothetical protein
MRLTVVVFVFTMMLCGNGIARQPDSLPNVTLDCYQSYVTSVALPEQSYDSISVDGDNVKKPRYRLQVMDASNLKIIEDPERRIYRKEYTKNKSELETDLLGKTKIVGWREDASMAVRLFTIDFDNNVFSILQIPHAKAPVPLALLGVTHCKPVP